jgi:hypothetical protein
MAKFENRCLCLLVLIFSSGIYGVEASSAPLTPQDSWFLQLRGALNVNRSAKVYDIDLFDNAASTFADLKLKGKTVICYFSAGSYEAWRPDADDIPVSARGRKMSGWDERWLDIKDLQVRKVMLARLDLAVRKGCDGVDPDNVDGFTNSTGFGIQAPDQIDYNRFLATEAHRRGLLIGLKNAGGIVGSLHDIYDFAVVEQCYQYDECEQYDPFIASNKAVFVAEYGAYRAKNCVDAKTNRYSLVYYARLLDDSRYETCP